VSVDPAAVPRSGRASGGNRGRSDRAGARAARRLGIGEDAFAAIERDARAEIAAATAAAAAALPPPSQRPYSEVQDCGAGRWRS